ncbi:hypothetical protein CJ030_MR2G026836 [Morella rubra]|uniref:PGG domain-containing protein n=1 Tax=Morella rubra TaxID=262757 RepID=A0A6A1WBT2_9ROSI|nr:hypothetical protein CJ030_MR2G026836 [Morella rubra]
MKTYLIAQDLWGVIEGMEETPDQEKNNVAFNAWSKKNSMALHVIQISCGPNLFSVIIREISLAKIAWNTLAKKYTMLKTTYSGTDNNRNDSYVEYEDLYKAVRGGDWNAAKEFLERRPDALNAKITTLGKMALHIAVVAGQERIGEKLVERMSREDLEILDNFGDTALNEAAVRGEYRLVKCMLRKNESLVSIGSSTQTIPLVKAISYGQIETARCLYSVTPLEDLMPEKDHNGATLLSNAIYTRNLDIALHLVKRCPRLALSLGKDGNSTLLALASTPNAFPSGNPLVFWKQGIYNYYEDGNGMLHMAGMFTDSNMLNHISGAALQMQRELQWFKEIESIVHPKAKEAINKDGMTPRQLFTKTHKNLRKEGEQWMKDATTSCTVVGALIITIMFAATFTIPGGNKQNTGLPMFLNRKWFTLFILSDALSLFSSTTLVLMFLGILTSRYAEDDFLVTLPRKMIIGFSTLFFSIATMMIAFCAALSIMLNGQYWIVILIICLASVPVTLFIVSQFRLLLEIAISTYRANIFNKKMKPLF